MKETCRHCSLFHDRIFFFQNLSPMPARIDVELSISVWWMGNKYWNCSVLILQTVKDYRKIFLRSSPVADAFCYDVLAEFQND